MILMPAGVASHEERHNSTLGFAGARLLAVTAQEQQRKNKSKSKKPKQPPLKTPTWQSGCKFTKLQAAGH